MSPAFAETASTAAPKKIEAIPRTLSGKPTPTGFEAVHPIGPILVDPSVLGEKETLLKAVNFSLQYLDTPDASKRYAAFAQQGIPRELIVQSLKRFASLV